METAISHFASDIGLTPGVWPLRFDHEGKTYGRRSQVTHGGEFVGYIYFCYSDNVHVTIWND